MTVAFIIGRIIVGGYFIYSAYGHFKNARGLAGYAGSKHVHYPLFAVIGTGILMLLGGISILAWVWVPVGIALLLIFLVPTTIIMHAFWKESDPMARMNQEIGFTKNLALTGMLVLVYALSCMMHSGHPMHGFPNHQPDMHQTMSMHMDAMTGNLMGKTGDAFDAAFLSDMIVHHQGAIDMAEMALTYSNHAELKSLATDIITAQTKEISQMKAWQTAWTTVKE